MNPRTARPTFPALFEGAGSFLPIDTLPWVKFPSFLRGFGWVTSMGIFFAGALVMSGNGIMWPIVAWNERNVKHGEDVPTMTTREQPDLMDAKQAAAYIGVHENTLYRLIQKNGFPTVRVTPKTMRFFKTDIVGWLEKRRDGAPGRKR
jgi:excisionase family DNA binding protein